MPQVSFEFLQIASLSRRRHGFDSRTGRQYCQSLSEEVNPQRTHEMSELVVRIVS
jgi:hypothetical protein